MVTSTNTHVVYNKYKTISLRQSYLIQWIRKYVGVYATKNLTRPMYIAKPPLGKDLNGKPKIKDKNYRLIFEIPNYLTFTWWNFLLNYMNMPVKYFVNTNYAGG